MVGIVTKICEDESPAVGTILCSNGQKYQFIGEAYEDVDIETLDLVGADVTFDPGPNRYNGVQHHGALNVMLSNSAKHLAYVAAMALRRLGDETGMTAFHTLYGPIECAV